MGIERRVGNNQATVKILENAVALIASKWSGAARTHVLTKKGIWPRMRERHSVASNIVVVSLVPIVPEQAYYVKFANAPGWMRSGPELCNLRIATS